ncbi:MAG: CopG family transcriptional regulator [Burkholderiaceae bacterium]
MKNVTITVDEVALEWARIEAAKRNTSVSRLVGEMLADKMRHDDAYTRAMRDWMSDTSSFTSGGAPYPGREATYAERTDRFR